MTSTTVINANATSKVQPSTAPPIEPLKNDMARLYTHIHPILVLSVYALKFPALVADPVQTLLITLVPLAVLQIAFVAICLPPTGGTPSIRNKKPGEKKGKAPAKLDQGLSSKIVVCKSHDLHIPYRVYGGPFQRHTY
jgi:phosphatidylinositol glycan class F